MLVSSDKDIDLEMTTIPMSNGDNPGLNEGVASGMVMRPTRHMISPFMNINGGSPATKNAAHDRIKRDEFKYTGNVGDSQSVKVMTLK